MNLRATTCLLVVAAIFAGCGSDDKKATPITEATPPTATAETSSTSKADEKPSTKVIASNITTPWGIAFLPSGDALVAERDTGKILKVPAGGGSARQVMTIPNVQHGSGSEDGLLGLAVSPTYSKDKLVYAYYSSNDQNQVARFSLGGTPTVILGGIRHGGIHNGGRIAFGPDGKLYIGTGETGNPPLAQDDSSLNGKILRVNPDGSIPSSNPIKGSAIWSDGHRNVQGLAFDEDGRLWESELGQDTWDEVNLIKKGDNGGWPNVEGEGSTDGGKYTNPKVTWPTSEASPSGAAIRDGVMYVAALRGSKVLRVKLDGTDAKKLDPIFTDHGRVRTVVLAPDDSLWIATSNTDGRGDPAGDDDKIYRVVP
jgi:glucose/arabinose dehydrogenase